MKKILLISAALMLTHAAFSQGTVTFANRGGTGTAVEPGQTLAPIYGLNSADPTTRRSGNSATGVPMGSTIWTGSAVLTSDATHTYVASLWALNGPVVGSGVNNNLVQLGPLGQPAAVTTFRVNTTSGTFAGIWNQPTAPFAVPGAATEADRPSFQVRVWDTRNGQINTWTEALAAWNAGQIAMGYSDLFTVPYRLGGTSAGQPNPAPFLQGLQSFNVSMVPEPSVIALGVLGAGCLFLLRRRK